MPLRGTYKFDVNDAGDILYTKNNVELIRKLWLDRELIKVEELGPGDEEEFEYGAWHIACHLVAACGVRKTRNGNLIWLEISYDPFSELYEPTLTIRENTFTKTITITSPEAQEYLTDSELLGFVEGTSEGRISAKGIRDDEKSFAGNPRQKYDQNPGSTEDGGGVWEHWSTTRDIRDSSKIGSSVLYSYVALVAVCGDKFVPTVARGRTDYFHPEQLNALIKAGFTSLKSAQINIQPTVIPQDVDLLLQEAKPEISLQAIEKLDWSNSIKYYMFERRIDSWNNFIES